MREKGRIAAELYRQLLPMPVAPLLLCQALITADGRVYRAVSVLAIAYWLSGCRPLPTETQAIAALIRMPQGNYTPIKPSVDAALAELLPTLAAEYAIKRKSVATMRASALHASRVAHASGPRVGKSFATPTDPTRTAPIKAPKYRGDNQTDNAARAASIARERTPRAHGHHASGLLSDGAPSGRK